MNPLIKGERGVSGTKTMLTVYVALVCVKYVLAGVSYGDFSVTAFDGGAEAAVIAALAALYGGRRYTEAKFRDGGPDG